MKRTNQHLHPPDEKVISCSEVKHILKEKKRNPKIVHIILWVTAPVQPTTLEQLIIPRGGEYAVNSHFGCLLLTAEI